MEHLLKQVQLLADHGINHHASEQVQALLEIISLLESEGVPFNAKELGLARNLFENTAPEQVHQVVSHNKVKQKLSQLLISLQTSEAMDPLVQALQSFLLSLQKDPLLAVLCQSERSLAEEFQLGHYLEADLAGKLTLLWKVLVRYGGHFKALPKLDNTRIEKAVAKNRDPLLKHFYPKTVDLLGLLLPDNSYQFTLGASDRHSYRQAHELIWQNGLRLIDKRLKVDVELSHISDADTGFFIDLKLAIAGRSHEWFYSVENLIDESIFEDLKRYASQYYDGSYLVENYGQSSHYMLVYLPRMAFEKIAPLA